MTGNDSAEKGPMMPDVRCARALRARARAEGEFKARTKVGLRQYNFNTRETPPVAGTGWL